MAPVEADHSLEAARSLKTTLENASLHIVRSQDEFDSKHLSSLTDIDPAFDPAAGPLDPALVALNVASQIKYLRKLKFQYLEQKAKDQYIKTIVSDEAPNINADDNEAIRSENEKKKQALKEIKGQLAEKYDDIQKLAPLVEQDYIKAKALTNEAYTLANQILDARLALARVRQAHPHPRLTVEAANAQLDSQVEEMQTLDDELQNINSSAETVKERVKHGARDLERLKAERAELEKKVRAGQSEAEDGRVMGLYDWFTASLALHRHLLSLESFSSPSENELRLVYALESPPRRICITMLFVPNTRRLADARVEGLQTDIGDVVDAHVQANDVPGLIAAILARARAGC